MSFSLRRKSQKIKTVETSRRRPFVPMTSHIHLLSCRLKEPQPGQYHCQLERYGSPTRQLKNAKEREGNTRFGVTIKGAPSQRPPWQSVLCWVTADRVVGGRRGRGRWKR